MLLSRVTGSVPVAACRSMTSLAATRAKLQATILLPLETRQVAHGNDVILSPNFVTKAPSRLTQLIIAVTAIAIH